LEISIASISNTYGVLKKENEYAYNQISKSHLPVKTRRTIEFWVCFLFIWTYWRSNLYRIVFKNL